MKRLVFEFEGQLRFVMDKKNGQATVSVTTLRAPKALRPKKR